MTKPPPDDLAPLRSHAVVGPARAAVRLEALLGAEDAAERVAALSVPDLYFLAKEVGLADCVELVALATPEQLRGCLDLEGWDRDQLDFGPVAPWLTTFIEIGYEKLAEVWAALDPEWTALFFARTTEIYDLTLDEAPPEDEERPIINTVDRTFALVLTTESGEEAALVERVLDRLYRGDMTLARHTLMSARSEMTSHLEEMCYRWRSGRVADLGYADFYEALEVFRPLAPDQLAIDEGTADPRPSTETRGLPTPVAVALTGRAFLARALAEVPPADAARVEAQLIFLVNRVLSAARVSPGDETAVRVGTELATATLALALEYVSAGQVDRAAAALTSISFTRLHRAGYTLTRQVAEAARRVARRASTAGERTAHVLRGLLGARPLYPRQLDGADGLRPIESLADLKRLAEHLAEVAARLALAEALGFDLGAMADAPELAPALDDAIRTALCRHLGGGGLDAAPLSPSELASFRRVAFDGAELTEAARQAAARAVAELCERAAITSGRELLPGLLSAWLDELTAGFGPLGPTEVADARPAGVLLSADKA